MMRPSAIFRRSTRRRALADIPTDIRLDQQHFEIFVKILVDRFAIEKAGDLAENATTGFLESLFELEIGIGSPFENPAEYQGMFS